MANYKYTWLSSPPAICVPALLAPAFFSPIIAFASSLSVDEAKALIFPEAKNFKPISFDNHSLDLEAIEDATGVSINLAVLSAWRGEGSNGAELFFFVDNVIGKHDYITYAVGIDSSGEVRGVEILEYRENFGGEIQDPNWREQFRGKTKDADLRVGKDIKNISGATMSCMHVSEGIKKLLHVFDAIRGESGKSP